MYAWHRIIRFQGEDGKTYYGEPILDRDDDLDLQIRSGTLHAKVIDGNVLDEAANISDKAVKVRAVLDLLSSEDIPIIRCIGLNYQEHAREIGISPPTNPVTFVKPATSVAGWNESIPIPNLVRDGQVDYEGELCFVIGKPAKDVPAHKALEYIAGFMVGNDVSTRTWQNDQRLSGPVPQFTFSKGFDKFAPLGPMLVSPKIVGNGQGLRLETRVNGDLRQSSNTSDLIFSAERIIEFMSQGTTLQKGCVIMTGTPAGAGFSRNPPQWLGEGDEVEVHIEKLGSIRNKFVYA